jgi:UDP:flavonoid glycosyltransferase YjiC (YdhE family)
MRVLFTVSAWPTHYLSMVPLGWSLLASGHEVRVLCAPSQVDPVTRAGLLAVPVLDGMGIAVHNRLAAVHEALDGSWPYPWLPPHPITGAPMDSLDDFDLDEYHKQTEPEYAAQAATSFDEAVRYARQWRPDLVVHDPLGMEGLLTARVLGVPAVLALWGPIGTQEPDGPALLPEDISESFPRYGLGRFGPDLVDHVLDPCPPAVEPPAHATSRLPARYIPYNGGGRLPEGLEESRRRPRICVTWSTALTKMCGPRSYLLPTIIEALAGIDADLVVTATSRDVAELGPVPAGVRVLEHCPLAPLLAGCDGVVHHGGSGSTMTALVAGVPQVAMTFASEQARVAGRMARAGSVIHLPGHTAGAETIRAAVERLLWTPGPRESAAALRDAAVRRPTPVELVNRLTALALG